MAWLSLQGPPTIRPGPPICGVLGQFGDGCFAIGDEGGFSDEVFGGVAGDGEFGGDEEVCAEGCGLGSGGADLGQVGGDLAFVGVQLCQRDAQGVGGGGHGRKVGVWGVGCNVAGGLDSVRRSAPGRIWGWAADFGFAVSVVGSGGPAVLVQPGMGGIYSSFGTRSGGGRSWVSRWYLVGGPRGAVWRGGA